MLSPPYLENIPEFADLAASAFLRPDGQDAPGWFAHHRSALLDRVAADGWALVRNVPICGADDFASAIAELQVPPAGHYGDLPFHPETEHVFHTTAYPKTEEILFHNEAAHQRGCPRYLFFCCCTPAASGGETPVSDGIVALRRLPRELLARLRDVGLLYKRRFVHGLDVEWQIAFGTGDRATVVAKCNADRIEATWQDDDGLAIAARVPALATALNGAMALCHQVELFHPVFLPPEVRTLMEHSYGPTGLPRDVAFGDRTPLSDGDALMLHEATHDSAFVFPWARGDILILDNFRIAHGRRSFTGDRSHFVMLSALERREMPSPST